MTLPLLSGKFTVASLRQAAKNQAVDWQALLHVYGLPKDDVDRIDRIFRTTPNLQQAIPIAQAYVRGTAWYTRTFPGIQEAISKGVVGDEQGYRSYQNSLDQLYKQYFGRPSTTAEVAQYLKGGTSLEMVSRQLSSKAELGNLTDPLKNLFSKEELAALTNEHAGIDSALGQKIAAEADLAIKTNTMYQDFFGRAVSRQEIDQLFKSGTTPEQVAKNFATQSNINGMNPAIRDLFTPQEIQQIALEQAGGTTENGKTLLAQANLAVQLNSVYHQYTGAGVSREEVAQAYQAGESPDRIAKRFAGQAFIGANRGDIQYAAGNFSEGQLTEPELQAVGEEASGYDTPLGQELTAKLEKAQRRISKVFNSTLASPGLKYLGGRLASNPKTPDVGA
jgi:hypothetical protein